MLQEGQQRIMEKKTMKSRLRSKLNFHWKPPAVHTPTLVFSIIVPFALILSLQLLLSHSQAHSGIIFAQTTDDIPLSKSFWVLYFPTIVSVVFGLFWNWVDLQIKRLEPWYRLSASTQENDGEEGVKGKDSLLLTYPFEFLAGVPMSAFRKRHWPVFWASTAVLLVTWGIVPLQAGIFSTETITRSLSIPMVVSTDFVPANKQNTKITRRFIDSTYGIIWLNETMPPYMTREYTLAPLRADAQKSSSPGENESWTGATQLYSVDLTCEAPGVNSTGGVDQLTSSNGCSILSSLSLTGNDTIGPNDLMSNATVYNYKAYSTIFAGYYATDWATFSLEGNCPSTANHTFFIAFAKNKERENDPPNNVTQLFCQPEYYMQHVVATVDAKTKAPIAVMEKGEKMRLPDDMYDAQFFETQMNSGAPQTPRGALPLRYWPDQLERLSMTQISLGSGGQILGFMAGFAIGAGNASLESYLTTDGLKKSYEAAYRIQFARSMVEILDQDFNKTGNMNGTRAFLTGAIILVPVFTYVVEGLLGLVAVCAAALLYLSWTREWKLKEDPATIESVMSLVADNRALLRRFSTLDTESMEVVERDLADRKFKLEASEEHGYVIAEMNDSGPQSPVLVGMARSFSTDIDAPPPVRPREFKSLMVVPFISLQIALAVSLGLLLKESQSHGIQRPSNNAIVRQLLENYIPTAFATLIEPVWVLINRLLCLLQPLEDLRRGRAPARKTISANYSSLPPQLVVLKALRNGHVKLAAVCLMALLANFLAVAFSGMFNEKTVTVPQLIDMMPPFQAKFVPINGSVGPNLDQQSMMRIEPSGAYTGGVGTDQFLIAESNYTSGTPLPAWTDDRFLYIPFKSNDADAEAPGDFAAHTQAFGANLDCQRIDDHDYLAEIWISIPFYQGSSQNLSFTMDSGNGSRVTCKAAEDFTIKAGPDTGSSAAIDAVDCQHGRVAMEFVLFVEAQDNATQAEKDFCSQMGVFGWTRDPGDICARNQTTVFNDTNALFVGCRPSIVAGDADVRVDGQGQIQEVSALNVSSSLSLDFLDEHFSNDAMNLLVQAGRYLYQFPGAQWHNDSYASDFLNYFMLHDRNSSRLIDPNMPLPSLGDVEQFLYPVYSRLFAIWLGVNKEKLLVPTSNSTTPVTPIPGWTYKQQTRIFLSRSLFILAECILSVYVFVAICVYLWRPGRYLPRMPTSIASVIALFAASSAVQDVENTSVLSSAERRKILDQLDRKYGYGRFVGSDGRVHVGIEREPFVTMSPVPGVAEKMQAGLSRRSTTEG